MSFPYSFAETKNQQSFKTFHTPEKTSLFSRLAMCFKGKKNSNVPKQFKPDSHTMSWCLKKVRFDVELPSRTSLSMAWLKFYLRVMVQSMRTTFSSCQSASRSSPWSNLNLRACSVLLRHEMGAPSWGFAHSPSHAPQGGDRTKNSRQHKKDPGVSVLNSNLERSKAKEDSFRRPLSQPVGRSRYHSPFLPPPEQGKGEHRSIHISSSSPHTPNSRGHQPWALCTVLFAQRVAVENKSSW